MLAGNRISIRFDFIVSVVSLALLSVFSSNLALAGSGATGADVLNIPICSRGNSLSGTGVAIARGTSALYYNPAGIGTGPAEISVTHSELLQDLNLNNVSASWSLGSRTGIGLGVTYLGYGDIKGYSADAIPTGEVSAYSVVASAGISHQLLPALSFGVTAKPIFEKLGNSSANTIAFDFGVLANAGPVAIGLELANLGGSLTFIEESAKLPRALRVGAAYSAPTTGYTISIATTRRAGDQVDLGGGVEYSYNSLLVFRVGYGSTLGDYNSSLDGLATGIGLKVQRIGLDYSYRPSDTQEGIHQITAVYTISR